MDLPSQVNNVRPYHPPLNLGGMTPHPQLNPYNSVSTTPMEVTTPVSNMVGQIPLQPILVPPTIEEMKQKFKADIDKLNELLNMPSYDARSFLQAGLPGIPLYPKTQMQIKPFEIEISVFFQKNPTSENVPVLLLTYLEFVKKQNGQMRVSFLLMLLGTLIKEGILNANRVCQSLLETITLHSPLFMQEGLKLVKQLLHTLDYKSCRVVISKLLILLEDSPKQVSPDGVSRPKMANQREIELLEDIRDLLEYILDRKSCLLPAYLALDEIEMRYSNKGHTIHEPHWIVADLLERFRNSFKGVASLMIMPIAHRLLPAMGVTFIGGISWQLDEELTLCPKLPKDIPQQTTRQLLPFPPTATQKRFDLVVHIVKQCINSDPPQPQIYGMPRQYMRQIPPEHQITFIISSILLSVELLMELLRSCEDGSLDDERRRAWSFHQVTGLCLNYWLKSLGVCKHIEMNSVFFLLYRMLSQQPLRKGRDAVMHFFVQALAFVFRSFESPLQQADLMLAIFDILYPDNEPLPIMDSNSHLYVYSFAPSYFWIHLRLRILDYNEIQRKNTPGFVPSLKFNRPMPKVIKKQIEFINELSQTADPSTLSPVNLIMLSNALPSHLQTPSVIDPGLKRIQEQLRECLNGRTATTPPDINMISCLNLNCKVDTIVRDMVSLVHDPQKNDTNLLEQLGCGLIIHTFFSSFHSADLEIAGNRVMTKTPADVLKKQNMHINLSWLEMVNHRLPVHVNYQFKHQLLIMITYYFKFTQEVSNYLYILLENTALKLIHSLAGPDLTHHLSNKNDPKGICPIDPEFEELNKAFILMLAQTIHTLGLDSMHCDKYLGSMMEGYPHSWPQHTKRCFPQHLQVFYGTQLTNRPVRSEEMQQLQFQVEEDEQLLKNQHGDNNAIYDYYMQSNSNPTLLCLTWMVIKDRKKLPNVFLQVFVSLGLRGLTRHIRSFVDFLVYKLCQETTNIDSYIKLLDTLIWTYNLFPLEKLILVMALKNYEDDHLYSCYRLMQLLLLVPRNFRERLSLFQNTSNSVEYWSNLDQFEDHKHYHSQHPEYFDFEGLKISSERPQPRIPFCGNVCIRFLPVIDIVIHRLIEVEPGIAYSFDNLIDQVGPLYKFHSRPITFLYTTLHYYEANLQNRIALKSKLVAAIIVSLSQQHPASWFLSSDMLAYIGNDQGTASSSSSSSNRANQIMLSVSYWEEMLNKITVAVYDPNKSCWTDWRFNEFSTPAAKVLHCAAVEMLTLPLLPQRVGKDLLKVALEYSSCGLYSEDREKLLSQLINSLALLMAMLPQSYHEVLYAEVADALQNIQLANYIPAAPHNQDTNQASIGQGPIDLDSFTRTTGKEHYLGCVLAIMHAFWTHSNIGLLFHIQVWLKSHIKPLVETENQLIFILQLIAPLIGRIFLEKRRLFPNLVKIIYDLVKQVDSNMDKLHHVDTICDTLYHIKYVYLGNEQKEEIEKIVPSLKFALQTRLKFLTGGDTHSSM